MGMVNVYVKLFGQLSSDGLKDLTNLIVQTEDCWGQLDFLVLTRERVQVNSIFFPQTRRHHSLRRRRAEGQVGS